MKENMQSIKEKLTHKTLSPSVQTKLQHQLKQLKAQYKNLHKQVKLKLAIIADAEGFKTPPSLPLSGKELKVNMKLERIKLAGFKSFVDPTTIFFPSNLIGIVGPNGCGKSNIIDAVRWVMGESSAKQLRGQSITDVIFNGSSQRKPVGQASIELIFNNQDGSLGGEYATYNQIAIRREVNRDGQSIYSLNNTRCRRQDIRNIFLGTGLGPRSYSIIEQGMISKLIEAKPEELRAYFEEAAGISKYKERRRETENRIQHTFDNLSRINDLREELAKQQEHLKRQAKAAKRYKTLKEQERLQKTQLLVLRWLKLNNELQNIHTYLQQQTTLLESNRSKLQHIDTQLEKQRTLHIQANDHFNDIQTQYYQLGNQIARLEQDIQHHKERHQQLTKDLEQTENDLNITEQSFVKDKIKLSDFEQKITLLKPQIEVSKTKLTNDQQALQEAEKDFNHWQKDWDECNQQTAEFNQKVHIQASRIQNLEQRNIQIEHRIEKLQQQLKQVDTSSQETEKENVQKELKKAQFKYDQQKETLTELTKQITKQRNHTQQLDKELETLRANLRTQQEEQITLQGLQKAALGQTETKVLNWLEKYHLEDQTRLVKKLQVKIGWEQAVELVLEHYLDAVCVENIDVAGEALNTLSEGSLTLLDSSTAIDSDQNKKSLKIGGLLSEKVDSALPVVHLLNYIYVTDSLKDALKKRQLLKNYESIITKEGIWVGKNWIHVSRKQSTKTGIIQREQKLKVLEKNINKASKDVDDAVKKLQKERQTLQQLEQTREISQQGTEKLHLAYTDLKGKFQILTSKIEQFQQTTKRISLELKEQLQQQKAISEDLEQTHLLWQKTKTKQEESVSIRGTLIQKREKGQSVINELRAKEYQEKANLHELELNFQSADIQLTSLKQAMVRSSQMVQTLKKRRNSLKKTLAKHDLPVDQMKVKFNEWLEKRLHQDKALTESKQQLNHLEYETKQLTLERTEKETMVQKVRNILEEKRLKEQEIKVRQKTIEEQLDKSAYDFDTLLKQLPEELTENSLEAMLDKTGFRVKRLGPINLAAIGEYEQVSERKNYLDAQSADLEEALETLKNAIHKIDHETRSRFKNTFDTTNQIFQQLFPKVFGGGKAYLELTDNNLLETGVRLMAKPPGKRITSIQLLSGGEKALTAIALIFSLFQMNPSPFCMLDEVDAALDDVNVVHFSDLVKESSKQVQFIFISHNKTSIEMADHLMGVTMKEPGVSRIVSVDVEAAIKMSE